MNIQIFSLVGRNSSSTRPAYMSKYLYIYTLVNSKIKLTSLIHENILECMNVMCVACYCHLYHIHKCSYYVVIFANYPKL